MLVYAHRSFVYWPYIVNAIIFYHSGICERFYKRFRRCRYYIGIYPGGKKKAIM